MKLQYGTRTHAINEAAIVISRNGVYSSNGYRIGTRERWAISGVLHGDNIADLTTKLAALESDYATNGLDLKLLEDDGTETAHKILTGDTVGGCRVLGVNYPKGEGAEYVTFRNYTITIEALRNDRETEQLSFQETIRHMGTGGPLEVWLVSLDGPPQKQTVAQQTPMAIVQSGQSVNYSTWGPAPSPIFPNLEILPKRSINLTSPQNNRGSLSNYVTTWSYTFESGTPIFTFPTV